MIFRKPILDVTIQSRFHHHISDLLTVHKFIPIRGKIIITVSCRAIETNLCLLAKTIIFSLLDPMAILLKFFSWNVSKGLLIFQEITVRNKPPQKIDIFTEIFCKSGILQIPCRVFVVIVNTCLVVLCYVGLSNLKGIPHKHFINFIF